MRCEHTATIMDGTEKKETCLITKSCGWNKWLAFKNIIIVITNGIVLIDYWAARALFGYLFFCPSASLLCCLHGSFAEVTCVNSLFYNWANLLFLHNRRRRAAVKLFQSLIPHSSWTCYRCLNAEITLVAKQNKKCLMVLYRPYALIALDIVSVIQDITEQAK